MDEIALEAIKKTQEDYFVAVKETDINGIEILNNSYNQILKSEGLGYEVSVYDGPNGKGYLIREERVVDGKTEQKTTNVGPETYRENDWTEVTNGQ